jgi:integrase
MDGVHFHDLRHADLTLSAQSGATHLQDLVAVTFWAHLRIGLAEVMRRAGHASSRAALTYQHAADARSRRAAARRLRP